MIGHAVWTGVAALLEISLGVAVGSFSGLPSLIGWPIVFVYGAATWVFLLPSETRGPGGKRPTTARGRIRFLIRSTCGVTGLAGLLALWILTDDWVPFFVGSVGTVAVIGVAFLPERAPSGARAGGGLRIERWHALVLTVTVLLAFVLPLVGFTGMGRRLGEYPWGISGALAVLALPFAAAGELGTYDPHGPGANRRVRLLTLGMTTLCLSGVVLAGAFFPLHAEVRLLAISAAMVTSVLAFAGLLYPQPLQGMRVSFLLVRLSFLVLVAGYIVLYLFL